MRFDRLQPLDLLMFFMYLGLVVWGTWAQIEPPLSLLGASGFTLTRVVTLGILVFAAASAVGLFLDAKFCNDGRGRLDIELPALLGLAGSWLTYVSTVWLVVAGHGDPHGPPVLAVFGVLATVFTFPFIVRIAVLVRDGIRTIKKARVAVETGVVDSAGNVL